MAAEPLKIFDPRRNFQLQGFTGRGATTTLHDASATGVSISGIFQAAEDFAVLGLYNAYDYFAHLRVKHLPRTDLSGLTLAFDIEYDHALDGAMRLDAAKYPSVSWDAMTFVCGAAGDVYDVHLLDYATVISGGESPASVLCPLSGRTPVCGTDVLHIHFRDTRYTVSQADIRWEGTMYEDLIGSTGMQWITVNDPTGNIAYAQEVIIERTGMNEEWCHVLDRLPGAGTVQLAVNPTVNHPAGSYVTTVPYALDFARKFMEIINTPGEPVAVRYGPDQSSVIEASLDVASLQLVLSFKTLDAPNANYGKLGNLDVVLMTAGHILLTPEEQAFVPTYDEGADTQGFFWDGATARFSGGDCDKKYRVTLPFASLVDKLGRTVPTNNCRKIYMVFAPRFERTEEELEDGCFLTGDVSEWDTICSVDDASRLAGGRYFVGDRSSEERLLLAQALPGQVNVIRGYEGTAPQAWPAGTRICKLSPKSGFSSDVEWRAVLSNIAVTGDASLKVGAAAPRVEESDARCKYTGYWENYKYGAAGWPSQWWSGGHARRTAPTGAGDVRKVALTYSQTQQHDLYLGTFLNTDCGKITVEVDGVSSTHDLYLSEYGGTTAMQKVRSNVAAGNHTVVITALFDRNAASSGYYCYFDYLWPLVPQDAPDAPKEYEGVSLAIDFDTDHGYKKPPAWHLWQLQKLGFKGHADVYMGVFWNNKRQRIGASYPYATVAFSGDPVPGDVVSISIAGTTIAHAIGYGETLQQIVSHFRATINGMFSGVWANDGFGTSSTILIQSKAPSYTFGGLAVSGPNSVTLTLFDRMGAAGNEGDWEILDSASPVMTEGARKWIRDLAGQFVAAGITASFAFSMEVYNPPAEMRAKYLRLNGGIVAPGEDVYLDVPSYQMHFGSRVRNYLRQMYRECADEIAAAGLPVVLQFGETQYWYFDNRQQDAQGGMPFYDLETTNAFAAAKDHQIWPFLSNTDDPVGDRAHPYETAEFLRDRIWSYCQDVIQYVRGWHPAAVFECLWPLDANQGKPAPNASYRQLLMYVNLPEQWKTSGFGIKYFRCEGFDYDIWQKNATLMRQTITFANKTLGRPAEECMYLAGLYGPPDPPIAQAYGMWKQAKLYSMCFWAFDQFCLNSRPVPLPGWVASATAAIYHKPRAARAAEVARAVDVVVPAAGAANRFKLNERKLNG